MTLPARRPLKGEVLPKVTIAVSQDPASPDGAWRVFSTDPRDKGKPLTSKGRLLGGTWDEAIRDADQLRATHGFHFERPSGLWLPSASPRL